VVFIPPPFPSPFPQAFLFFGFLLFPRVSVVFSTLPPNKGEEKQRPTRTNKGSKRKKKRKQEERKKRKKEGNPALEPKHISNMPGWAREINSPLSLTPLSTLFFPKSLSFPFPFFPLLFFFLLLCFALSSE